MALKAQISHITFRLRPVAAAIALAGAGTVLAQSLAQSPNTAGSLSEVKVTTTGDKKINQLSSTKATAPLLDTPQTITVITTEVLQKQGKVTLLEALSSVPGITLGAGEGGGGYGDSINFRGYSANNNITVDNLRDSAQYTRSDTFNLEKIEIANGANSVYSGAGSISGSINLVSKVANADNFTNLSAGIGTDSYGRLTGDLNRTFSDGKAAARLNVMVHNNDVPGRDVETYKRWGIAPSIAFGVGGSTQLTLSYIHQTDDNIPQYGVPYHKNAYNNNGPLPGASRSNYYGYKNIDKQEIDLDQFTAIFDHRFNNSLKVRSTLGAGRIKQLTLVDPPQGVWCLLPGSDVSTGASCTTPGFYLPSGPRGNTRDTVNDRITSQTDFTSNLKTGSIEHTLVAGFSISRESYELVTGNSQRNLGGKLPNPTLPLMSITDPNNIYGGPVNFIASGKTDGDLNNTAIYLFDNLKFNDHWSLNGGLRYERYSASARSTTSIATPDLGGAEVWANPFDNKDSLFSYRLGLIYKPAANGSIYAAYGNSLTPSTATVNRSCSAATCAVDPEKAINIELGTKWDLLNNRLALSAAIFRNALTNYKVASNNPAVPAQQLDGESRVDGLALGAAGKVTSAWELIANYTYLKSKVVKSASKFCVANPGAINCGTALASQGNPLTNTPEHAFSVWTTYALTPAWAVGYGVTYQGSWYLNNGAAPLYKAPDYIVQNAMVTWKVNQKLDLQLNVKNLTDKLYHTRIRNNGWAVPGDGRSAMLSANYAF